MTKIRKKIGTIPINDIEQQVQQSTQAAVTQMQQDVSDFIDEETAQYPEIGGAFKFQEDPEGRSEITTDSEQKIISYRDTDGVLHENAGINTPSINADDSTFKNLNAEEVNVSGGSATLDNLTLTKEGMGGFKKELKESGFYPSNDIKDYNLPEIGTINLVSETFYLTSNSGYSDETGIYPIQLYENTVENAQLRRVCQKYYVKSSLVDNGDGTYSLYNDGVEGHDIGLDFYTETEVTLINGVYYVTDSLEEGTVVPSSIIVTQIVDTPNLQAWKVDKKVKHHCVVEINFGNYLSGVFSVEVKFQGSSTLLLPKRNLRFTFYKNSGFTKKMKVKVGEMIRTSGFNLKAAYNDDTRMREYLLYRVFMAVWENRHNPDTIYPWIKDNGFYTGATGMIKCFPIRVSVGNDFYGIMHFGLKKDEKNYLLDGDDDTSGIFVSGETGEHIYDAEGWSDEMAVDGRQIAYPSRGDESVSVETASALNSLFRYIVGEYKDENDNIYGPSEVWKINEVFYVKSSLTKNVDGTYSINENSIPTTYIKNISRSTASEHISVLDFIDYLICLEVFNLPDNTTHNMILYSGRDKKLFYPFMYDLDQSLSVGLWNVDTFSVWNPNNTIFNDRFWCNIFDIYKDELYNRYNELKKSIININYIKDILDNVYSYIPEEWFVEEKAKWGNGDKKLYEVLDSVEKRINWIDVNIFNTNI